LTQENDVPTFAGKDGRVRLAPIVFDAEGRPVADGPSGNTDLGQVIGWRVRHSQTLVESSAFGDEFRTYAGGLMDWDAEVDMLWDADASALHQSELWECILSDDFSGSLADQGRIELTLLADGESANAKRAYYGPAVLRDARVVLHREQVVRLRAEFVGIGPLRYRAAFFAAGAFGAMEGYTFGELNAFTFGGLETIPEK
jgi:hypothetical protein